jgi:hypothetical protein
VCSQNRAGSGPGPNPDMQAWASDLLSKQKPEPAWAWFLGQTLSSNPEPANQARPTKAQTYGPSLTRACNLQARPGPT